MLGTHKYDTKIESRWRVKSTKGYESQTFRQRSGSSKSKGRTESKKGWVLIYQSGDCDENTERDENRSEVAAGFTDGRTGTGFSSPLLRIHGGEGRAFFFWKTCERSEFFNGLTCGGGGFDQV